MKKLFVLLLTLVAVSCSKTGERGGHMKIDGHTFSIGLVSEWSPSFDYTPTSHLVRVETRPSWGLSGLGMYLMLWIPPGFGLTTGVYGFDADSTEPFTIAGGAIHDMERTWEKAITDGTVEFHIGKDYSCRMTLNLVIEGGGKLTGKYNGGMGAVMWD